MRLREYIDKSAEEETPRGRLMRAIDLSKDQEDLEMAASLIASMADELDDGELMDIQQHWDRKNQIYQSQHRKLQ